MAQITGETGAVYAVDSNQAMLNSLKENIAKSSIDKGIIKIVNNDVCHTGITDKSVDVVFFANVLHEVDDKLEFFQKIKRISKPTAIIVDIAWKKIQTERGPPLKERLSEEEAKQVLSENDFKVINQTDVGPYHYEVICRIVA